LPWHAGGLPSAAYAAPELAAAWAPPRMGQVAGIARGHNGSVWAFQRAGRVWGPQSFDASQERITDEQPIGEDVMLELDQDSGAPCICQAPRVPCWRMRPLWRSLPQRGMKFL